MIPSITIRKPSYTESQSLDLKKRNNLYDIPIQSPKNITLALNTPKNMSYVQQSPKVGEKKTILTKFTSLHETDSN
jgi:hypothetical protein